MSNKPLPEGGYWLAADTAPEDVFTPEDFTEEQRGIASAFDDFAKREVAPHMRALESHDHALLIGLMGKCGEQGFLGIEIPEEHGGLGQGPVSAALAFERVAYAGSASLAATYGAHTGIGTIPVLLYGTPEQRAKYLPSLASGERIAAYALTEPGSGSDALAAKTTAELSIDKTRWRINGSKLFITNGGFAKLFTVFVKIDGQNACVLVEGGALGLTLGKEEEKMGLHGSSTVELHFDNCLTDASNLLGEIGKGHKIVLNTLNVGRLKLAAAKVGLIKRMVDESTAYVTQRKQFGKPLLDCDLTRAKLADMAVDGWVGEAMTYRVAKLVEDRIHAGAPLEQLSQECALVKVALSEWGCNAVDEAVQLHGGVGYTEEYLACRAYRDCRISRIYEGTSEINRFAVIDGLGKQVKTGKLNVFDGHPATAEGIAAFDANTSAKYGPVEAGRQAVPRAKAAVRFLLVQAMTHHLHGLANQQQLLVALADAVTAVYAMESAELRFRKIFEARGESDLERSALYLCWDQEARRIEDASELVLMTLPNPAENIDHASKLLRRMRLNAVDLRQRIGKAIVAKGGYPF